MIFPKLLNAQPAYQCLIRRMSSPSVITPQLPYKESKVKVLDCEVNCLESLENEKSAPPIFYLPGVFGSIEMDFKPIISQLNLKKYKWISWDPPGHGKSIPPKRPFCSETFEAVYEQDVKYVKELMNMMGYSKYTLLAWSGAAITAIMIAAEQPEKVSGLITWGAFGYASLEMVPKLKMMKKIGLAGIPEPRKSQLLEMYGEQYLLEMWNGWCDEAVRMSSSSTFKQNGGSYQKIIARVQCPSLVIHGTKDSLVEIGAAYHLNKTLKGSSLNIIEKGTHNLHLRSTKEFVECIEQFVDSTAINHVKISCEVKKPPSSPQD